MVRTRKPPIPYESMLELMEMIEAARLSHNKGVKVALKDADFIKREEALGAVIVTDGRLNPAEHKKFVASEIDKWAPVIKAAGQYAD